jgi:hypothetical protein
MDIKTSSKTQSVNWGKLKQLQIPFSLLEARAIPLSQLEALLQGQGKAMQLSAPALTTYIVLLYLYRGQVRSLKPEKRKLYPVAEVRASRKTLRKYTGYSERQLIDDVSELNKVRLIATSRLYKRDKSNSDGTLSGTYANHYYLLHPKTGDPFESGLNVLFMNRVRYFTMPLVMVSEINQPWALANLSSSQAKVYLASLWLANRNRCNSFNTPEGKLRSIAKIADKRTFEKALDMLQELGLLSVKMLDTVTGNSQDIEITLCDPTTGEPVVPMSEIAERNPANYHVEGRNRSTRFIVNSGTEEDREKQLMSFLPPNTLTEKRGNGDIFIQCPYHAENAPSCSVNPKKRCFHCFGCRESGTLLQLLTKLNDGDTAATMSRIAASREEAVTYRDPDESALAIYDYIDADGELMKQVLRYPDDEDGRKVIRQRRLAKRGGWAWNTDGLGPLLYHTELLKDADVVCVTEGEKDADSVTDLLLTSLPRRKRIIGVTSGGSDTWDANLAELLKGKRVVVMPDADEPGAKFGEAVTKSLDALGIEYRVVTFEDVACKDVTDYLELHSACELAERIGTDWVHVPEPMLDDEIIV